jgi:D-alanyl-D-alanine carboxypeptidase (penicillin-binding protein 5/6)
MPRFDVARWHDLPHKVRVRYPRFLRLVRYATFLGAALAFLTSDFINRALADDASIKAYIVADDKTGHIFLEANRDDKLQIGSLTKVATAVVVLDWARLGGHTLDQPVTMPADDAAAGSNPVGFQPGDAVSLRDLLYAMLLQSDNLAADALAQFVGRALPRAEGGAVTPTVRFVAEMNVLARSQGMLRTRFLNPSGVDATERPFSTAADLGRLTHMALSKADFRFFVAQKERRISIDRAGVKSDYLLRNTNELLGVNGIDGVKTGQTAKAGSCVIISAARPSIVVQEGERSVVTPRRLIVVVLGSQDRFRDAASLLERGTSLYDEWAAAGYPANPKETL